MGNNLADQITPLDSFDSSRTSYGPGFPLPRFLLGVVDRFLRRSGSRVSILIACQADKVSLALSLREIPIPSRITRKSLRPRASDRSMCCQPGNRPACQSSATDHVVTTPITMPRRWNHARPAAEPESRKPEPSGAYNTQGLEVAESHFPSSRGRKMSLTFPSYRAGDYTL